MAPATAVTPSMATAAIAAAVTAAAMPTAAVATGVMRMRVVARARVDRRPVANDNRRAPLRRLALASI